MSLADGLGAKVQELGMKAFAGMGGVGTVEDTAKHVWVMLDAEERKALAFEGITKLVSARFRRTGQLGLPEAPAVDYCGTHMQLSLLTPEEYKFVIASCLRGKRRYQKRAEQYRDACVEVHGVTYDLAEIEAELSQEAA